MENNENFFKMYLPLMKTVKMSANDVKVSVAVNGQIYSLLDAGLRIKLVVEFGPVANIWKIYDARQILVRVVASSFDDATRLILSWVVKYQQEDNYEHVIYLPDSVPSLETLASWFIARRDLPICHPVIKFTNLHADMAESLADQAVAEFIDSVLLKNVQFLKSRVGIRTELFHDVDQSDDGGTI